MRAVQKIQMDLGEIDPRFVFIDPKNRDELTDTLVGIQHLYQDANLRQAIFGKLESLVPEYRKGKSGRPGTSMWEALVLAVVRLSCNFDYDMLKSMADNHRLLRQMLGLGLFSDKEYALQTIRDNFYLLTDEVLDEIGTLVVNAGHRFLGYEGALDARADSFVVHSNVHYPTDINLLLDAMRKSIQGVATLADELGLPGWRKSIYNAEKIRIECRSLQRMKHSTSKKPEVKEKRERQVMECHKDYIDLCQRMLDKVDQTLDQIEVDQLALSIVQSFKINDVRHFMGYATHQIELIRRRVLNGETIPHSEKIFSIFEPYTEWICKGKAGVRQELGLNVCVVSDSMGFILHHRVMQNEVDVDIAVAVTEATLKDYQLRSISFDKGFHSPANQINLANLVEHVVLPKKGRRNKEEKERESTPDFVKRRYAHSAIESTINGLDHGGLDRCPDRSLKGFKRYVAVGILARNLKTLGAAVKATRAEEQKAA
jgi:IS5 family transposase